MKERETEMSCKKERKKDLQRRKERNEEIIKESRDRLKEA